jgi:hypothetical protein
LQQVAYRALLLPEESEFSQESPWLWKSKATDAEKGGGPKDRFIVPQHNNYITECETVISKERKKPH